VADSTSAERPTAGERTRAGGRWALVAVVAAGLVVVVGVVGAVAWRRMSEPPPVATSVRCSVYWRDSDRVAPTPAGDVTLPIRNPPMGENEERLDAGSMSFVAKVPNEDPGMRAGAEGGDLIVEVADAQGSTIVHQLFQIWQGPTEEFGGGTGFTGLVYVNDPATGAEVQYTCAAVN
jgi:hypothetical protein